MVLLMINVMPTTKFVTYMFFCDIQINKFILLWKDHIYSFIMRTLTYVAYIYPSYTNRNRLPYCPRCPAVYR